MQVKLITILLFLTVFHTAQAFAVGQIPVPYVKNLGVETKLSYNRDPGSDSGLFTYKYKFSSKNTNKGDIWKIGIDLTYIKSPNVIQHGNEHNLFIHYGRAKKSFSNTIASLSPLGLPPYYSVMPVGLEVPSGWVGGITRAGEGMFAVGSKKALLKPGSAKRGFKVLTYYPPTIGKITFYPDWMFVVKNHDTVTEKEKIAAGEILRKIQVKVDALVPTAGRAFSVRVWTRLKADIEKAKKLNWIVDKKFASNIKIKFEAALSLQKQGDVAGVNRMFGEIEKMLKKSKNNQRTQNGFDLIFYNLKYFQALK